MLDSVQNHALRLCLGASRTSPCPSLSVEANEPPLNLRQQKFSLQYALRLSSNYQNPAYICLTSLLTSLTQNLAGFFRTNPIKFLHLAFVYHLIFMQSDSERNLLHNQPPYLLLRGYSAALWLISDFTARIKILLLPKFSRIVFMNCITATVITITSTQMVPKVMTG